MAKRKSPYNQIRQLPEYGELVNSMQMETASILTDYIRQYVGVISGTPQPGEGIFLNFDRVLRSQSYQELAWYDLYAELERDPHIYAVLSSAKINVAGMKWDVIPHIAPREKKPSSRDQAVADFVKDALGGVGYFPQHTYNLLGAIGMGFAVSEIVWDIGDDGVVPRSILNRPQRRFQFDATDRSLKLRTVSHPYYGEPLPDKKFIVHRCSSQWDNPFGDALDQSLYWMWLFKRTVLKFWMQHLEVGAASVPIVQHPAAANPELKAEALSIAKQIRSGAYGRLPDNFTLLWAEAKNAITNAETYNMFLRMCNDEMSKCVNGQTLTMEAGSASGMGSRALGKVHETTQSQRDTFRAETLAATYNETIVKWLCDFNFTGLDGYPQFRFDLEDEKDLEVESRIVKNLTDSGYEINADDIAEKFNYAVTKKEPKPTIPPNEPFLP